MIGRLYKFLLLLLFVTLYIAKVKTKQKILLYYFITKFESRMVDDMIRLEGEHKLIGWRNQGLRNRESAVDEQRLIRDRISHLQTQFVSFKPLNNL